MTEQFDSAAMRAADRDADPARKPRCGNCRRWDAIMTTDPDGREVATGTGRCMVNYSATRRLPGAGVTRGTWWCQRHAYAEVDQPAPVGDTGGLSWSEMEWDCDDESSNLTGDKYMEWVIAKMAEYDGKYPTPPPTNEADITRRIAEAVEAERIRVLNITGCTRGQEPNGTQFCALLDHAVAAEREACAAVAVSQIDAGARVLRSKIARGMSPYALAWDEIRAEQSGENIAATMIAAAIRARGNV